MKKYVYIGLGGFLGSISRYLLKAIPIWDYNHLFPLNTLIINVSGSLLLAFIYTAASDLLRLDEDLRLGVGTGFIGAYTTFSTLCKETIGLFSAGRYFFALSYAVISAALGLGAAYLGALLAERAGFARYGENEDSEPDIETESEVE